MKDDPDEFIPERYVKGDSDPMPWIILWIFMIAGGVIWTAS